MNGLEIVVSKDALNGLTNYDELIAYSKEQLKPYEGMLVTEDQIGAAKDIVARMRKVAKAASDLRIRTEKEHAAKIALTVQQLKEISSTFTDAAGKIDTQVKEIVSKRKAEKRSELEQYFLSVVGIAGKYIDFVDVEDEKWQNASVSIETAKAQIDEAVKEFQSATMAVESLEAEPAIKAAVQNEFKRTKSLAKAVQLRSTLEQMAAEQKRRREAEQAAREKAEKEAAENAERLAQEAKTAEAASEPVQQETSLPVEEVWEITFAVSGTRAQFAALKEFLIRNGMKYRRA